MEDEDKLISILEPLSEGMGCRLVDAVLGRHRGDFQIHVVLHKEGGIGLEDLERAQKTMRPRLELEYGRDDLSLEISSPGTNRILKKTREYRVFMGSRMKVLVGEDWVTGTLHEAAGDAISLETSDGIRDFPINAIKKGKLVI